MYNDDTHGDRGSILDRLREVPAIPLAAELEMIRDLVLAKVGNEFIDVIRILELLSLKELHSEAATLADEALSLVPDVKSREYERQAYASIRAAERAEALIAIGQSNQAALIIGEAPSPLEETDKGLPL